MNVPASRPTPRFDAFLSHASPDKEWVRALGAEMEKRGLRVYLDEKELEAGRNFVRSLDGGLAQSRFLVLVLSQHSSGRDWVEWEYSTVMADRGPLDPVIPVRIDDVPLPHALAAIQAVNALDRDPVRAAETLCRRIRKTDDLPPGDARRLTLGQRLVFVLGRSDDHWTVRGQDGKERQVEPPQRQSGFAEALGAFRRLVRTPAVTDAERADLFHAATTIGRGLFDVLFDDAAHQRLRQALVPGERPLLTLLGDDEVLALP
jgi:hypothetical protein